MPSPEQPVDVVVIGGSISGSATALMLLRKQPDLKVWIIERDSEFKRRVGESTVEMSSYFLTDVLDLGQYLNEHHLIKQGLRFWFYRDSEKEWTSCSEIGPEYHVRLPGFQVDRSTLDAHVLSLAVAAGATLKRGWKVRNVSLAEGAFQQLQIVGPEGELPMQLRARWVVDAAGSQCLLARQLKVYRANERHPISSIWCRWTGVRSLDSAAMRGQCPHFAARCKGTRYTATNHFIGQGWWAWCIPLKSGDVSIGIVYDERKVDLAGVSGLENKLKQVLFQHPVARELLRDAHPVAGDMNYRRKLPYYSERFFGDGFCLVGDAAGFIDPFYSPGLDWVAYTTCSTVELISKERRGQPIEDLLGQQNQRFSNSYKRWFEAIYENKYDYMGDYELMDLAFRLDLGTYYLGVVSQPYKLGVDAYSIPSFSGKYSEGAAWVIRQYNRRLSAIARRRLQKGTWGKQNHHHHHRFQSYELNSKLPKRVAGAFFSWLILEFKEGWRTWFQREKSNTAQPEYLR